jgi:flagellar hook assembly protein FlgD
VYDATGRRVRRLVHGEQPAGIRTVTWDGRNDAGLRVSAGVYFLRLETVQTTRLRKVVLTR